MNEVSVPARQRFYSIDTCKALCALFVVCLHTPMPDEILDYVRTIARVGVPFFFVVSGFFSFSTKEYTKEVYRKKFLKTLNHIIVMLEIDVAYILFNVAFFDKSLESQINILFKPNFLIANFGVAGHIWFMRALIYLELFVLVFHKILKSPKLKYVVLGVWLFDLVFCKYSFLFNFTLVPESSRELVSKFIGNAFVYFFLGWEMRREQDRISSWVREKVGGRKIGIMLIAAVVLNLAEYQILTIFQRNQMPVNYFFTFIIVNLLFMLLIAYPDFGKNTIVNVIGEKYSMHIYYWHIMLRNVLSRTARLLEIPKMLMVNPIPVYIVSIVAAFFIIQVKKIKQME